MNIKEVSIIAPEIINLLWLNKNSTKSTLSRYEKEWKFIRIKRGLYINANNKINIFELSNIAFKESYISLETVLYEEWIIKQYSRWIYSISNSSKSEILEVNSYKLYNYKSNIKSNLGIYIDNNWIRKATIEKAILDSIYFRIASKNYPWDSEIYVKNVNTKLMDKILPLYPKRVQNYYLKLVNE